MSTPQNETEADRTASPGVLDNATRARTSAAIRGSSETFGVLLAISQTGAASVVSICTASEAQGMADDDFRRRDPETDICPEAYEFHARNESGKYVLFATITP